MRFNANKQNAHTTLDIKREWGKEREPEEGGEEEEEEEEAGVVGGAGGLEAGIGGVDTEETESMEEEEGAIVRRPLGVRRV